MAEPNGLPTSLPECVRQTRTQVPFDLLDNTNNHHLRCDVHTHYAEIVQPAFLKLISPFVILILSVLAQC